MAKKQLIPKFQSFEVCLRKGEWLGAVITIGAICVLACLFALLFNDFSPAVDWLICGIMLGVWLVVAVQYIRIGRIRIFVEQERFTVTTANRSSVHHRYEEITRMVQRKQRFGCCYDLYAEETMICRFSSSFTNAQLFLHILKENRIPLTESRRSLTKG